MFRVPNDSMFDGAMKVVELEKKKKDLRLEEWNKEIKELMDD